VSENNGRLRRRDVLVGAGAAGLGALAVGSGAAAADGSDEYNVGTASPAAERAAKAEAREVERVLAREGDEKTVTGAYSEEAIERLRNRPDVRYTEVNGEMHAIGQTLPWGVDRVDADVVHGDGETGSGADIAVIDTGIDDDHPDLQSNVGSGKAFVDCRGPNCNHPWSDDNDHGTHCAGIADAVDNSEGVVGVSTEATLHAVKVLDNNGSGSYSDVAAGIEYTADQGWDVGSLSLGGDKSSAVEDACEYAHGKGVLLVAAAGNDGPCSDCVSYPAAEPEVVAVSATEEDDSLASYSSTGPEVELAAPGSDVYSTVIGGYDTFSGTSMACPHVSGAGGQLMANGYTNTEARQQLKDTAEDLGLGSNEQGAGLLDVEAALDGSGDSSPACSLVDPDDGDTVSGTVTVRVDASDGEDDDADLDVDVSIDGGEWRDATYSSDSGYHEYDWDTTAVDDGDHTIQARATDSDGETTESDRIPVTVDNVDVAPVIDALDLTDDSNPAWTRYYVDWAVSDDDGDLSSVTSELLDASGSVLDAESSSVGGTSASGTHYVESKDGGAEIRLTVADDAGNSTAETEPI